MKKYKLLALTTVLALAGCATTGPSGEAGVAVGGFGERVRERRAGARIL